MSTIAKFSKPEWFWKRFSVIQNLTTQLLLAGKTRGGSNSGLFKSSFKIIEEITFYFFQFKENYLRFFHFKYFYSHFLYQLQYFLRYKLDVTNTPNWSTAIARTLALQFSKISSHFPEKGNRLRILANIASPLMAITRQNYFYRNHPLLWYATIPTSSCKILKLPLLPA